MAQLKLSKFNGDRNWSRTVAHEVFSLSKFNGDRKYQILPFIPVRKWFGDLAVLLLSFCYAELAIEIPGRRVWGSGGDGKVV